MAKAARYGAKHTGRTFIYRGFLSLRSQGGLWPNPSLNRFKSTKLEIKSIGDRTRFGFRWANQVKVKSLSG
jgi:hypothetical protein